MAQNTPKILVVDDEHINVDFFEVMLSRLGYTVVTAGDGDEALEQILREKPDLVLLDNILPGRTGWEVTRLVKQNPDYAEVSATPIIMFSAMDEVEDKIEGFELGIEDYITKPYNFSEVLARIQAVLRQRELSRQVARRERRLALVDSLNNSLAYFTRHIKNPIQGLNDAAKALDVTNPETVRSFVELVLAQTAEALATVEGLEDEVQELQTQGDELKSKEISLEDLESKFRKHAAMAVQGVPARKVK
ncbi:Response regulator receiver domain-containing protein [Alkalispirochaeta americana]|uniref:Response regulator receiver domain-containing protein n=1 Tax=Alkalispirochaeta americana TaxID=159291 RepID=A0A1N6W3R6_9SPIO|nr:response regulator [Alkalispirochaeta americana]SIQ84632.1 Response regulator receiver domain-containing protein [Alkalispirochaeta americana]